MYGSNLDSIPPKDHSGGETIMDRSNIVSIPPNHNSGGETIMDRSNIVSIPPNHNSGGSKSFLNCLAKVLTIAEMPFTIGLYAPWGSGTNIFLKEIEESLKKQEENTDDKESPCITKKLGILCFIFRLLFFSPIITAKQKDQKKVRFIFVPFNAWEFAASDRLWAGMMTTLCANVRSHFGPLPSSIYRALGKTTVSVNEKSLQEWKPVKYLGIPAWIATIIIAVLAIILVIVILVFGLTIDFVGDLSLALVGFGGSIVGASALIMIKHMIVVAYHFVLTQKSRIEKEMDNKNFSSQLGFVNQVKEEVEFITNFVCYMEVFQQCKVRLVLKIQDLDRCPHEKITSVLEAMNILLSVKQSRFISLLTVDPTLIIRSFEYASQKNGYEILNRTVDLPFSIPEMRDNANLNGRKGSFPKTGKKGHAVHLINQALNILKNCETSKLFNINRSERSMRRIINAVPLIIRLLFAKNGDLLDSLSPEKIVAWTVLATQWPCRLSWILQCEEDIKERMRKTSKVLDDNRFLWDIYTESMEELRFLMNGIDGLFILDGDPDDFEKHLNRDYPFTTRDLEILHPITVNLDRSIQRRMKLLREKHYIRNYQLHPDSGKQEPLFPLQPINIFSLTSEEICSELELFLKDSKHLSAYKQCLMDENITGKVLLYSPESEIQKVLNMQFADWALFRAHFLLLPQAF